MNRLLSDFFQQEATEVACRLLGKQLVRVYPDGSEVRYTITETEAYLGEDDEACHASKGQTLRTQVMYAAGGKVYVYLIYGMYWMLNVVTGPSEHPQAVLVRGIDRIIGPGKVGRELKIDKTFYGEDLLTSERIWIEDAPSVDKYRVAPRVGIGYVGEEWKSKPWRFIYESFGR